MATAASAVIGGATPPIAKNAYFTFAPGSTHRDAEQKWVVNVPGPPATAGATPVMTQVTIWVQGNVAGKGFDRDATYFAKKHLLTFKGGKAANAGGKIDDKMIRIANKRKFHLTGSMKKGNTPIPADTKKITDKYSTTPAKTNTLILCDELTPDELKLLFAKALLAGSHGEAHVILPGNAVKTCLDGNPIPQKVTGVTSDKDMVAVELGYSKATGKQEYLIVHLGGAAKV